MVISSIFLQKYYAYRITGGKEEFYRVGDLEALRVAVSSSLVASSGPSLNGSWNVSSNTPSSSISTASSNPPTSSGTSSSSLFPNNGFGGFAQTWNNSFYTHPPSSARTAVEQYIPYGSRSYQKQPQSHENEAVSLNYYPQHPPQSELENEPRHPIYGAFQGQPAHQYPRKITAPEFLKQYTSNTMANVLTSSRPPWSKYSSNKCYELKVGYASGGLLLILIRGQGYLRSCS